MRIAVSAVGAVSLTGLQGRRGRFELETNTLGTIYATRTYECRAPHRPTIGYS
jgi:hypothetical protein